MKEQLTEFRRDHINRNRLWVELEDVAWKLHSEMAWTLWDLFHSPLSQPRREFQNGMVGPSWPKAWSNKRGQPEFEMEHQLDVRLYFGEDEVRKKLGRQPELRRRILEPLYFLKVIVDRQRIYIQDIVQ